MRSRSPRSLPSGEIRGYFAIDRTPAGKAPAELREKWVGLMLPVRYERDPKKRHPFRGVGAETKRPAAGDDGVWILSRDAIVALDRAGASDAAAYWEVMMANFLPALIFNASEGRLLSIEEATGIAPDVGDIFDT